MKLKEKIKILINIFWLKLSERKWDLYNALPEFKIEWLFAFIDQKATGGHTNTQLIHTKNIQETNSIIITNLNNRVSEDTLIHTFTHEALHIAISHCIFQQYNFIEIVIDKWILEKEIRQKDYYSNLYIHNYKY